MFYSDIPTFLCDDSWPESFQGAPVPIPPNPACFGCMGGWVHTSWSHPAEPGWGSPSCCHLGGRHDLLQLFLQVLSHEERLWEPFRREDRICSFKNCHHFLWQVFSGTEWVKWRLITTTLILSITHLLFASITVSTHNCNILSCHRFNLIIEKNITLLR